MSAGARSASALLQIFIKWPSREPRVPKLIHNVTIEAFARRDTLGEMERAIDALVPVPMVIVRGTQWRRHPEKVRTRVYELPKRGVRFEESITTGSGDEIIILTYRFAKGRDMSVFGERLKGLEEAERRAILDDPDGCLDEEGRLLLRVSKRGLREGVLRLMRREEFLMLRVKLAAYPRNAETCRVVVRSLVEGRR